MECLVFKSELRVIRIFFSVTVWSKWAFPLLTSRGRTLWNSTATVIYGLFPALRHPDCLDIFYPFNVN